MVVLFGQKNANAVIMKTSYKCPIYLKKQNNLNV